MCGIVGFIDKNKNIDTLNDMLEIQSYRGPDDSGVYSDEKSGVHLGHNRLSIQDLTSHGHQPFVSDCGNYIIVFNGEVYNFKIIKNVEKMKEAIKLIINDESLRKSYQDKAKQRANDFRIDKIINQYEEIICAE